MKNVTSIHRELEKLSEIESEETALKDSRNEVTFSELDARANRVARSLRKAGFGPGDKVAVLLSNRLEWGEIQYGCFRAGVVPAGINFMFSPDQVTGAINSIDADGFIFESKYADLVTDIQDDLSLSEDRLIELGSNTVYRSYSDLLKGQSRESPSFDGLGLDDDAVIWYTSGTTGQPKPIVWTQRSLINHFFLWGYSLEINSDTFSFLLMPFFHANSQLCYFNSLYLGAGVYVHRARSFDPDETLRLMEDEEATFTSMVPTHYNQMLYETDVNKYDLSSVETVLSSSAPLSQTLKRELRETLECDIAEAYGASETGIPIMLPPGAPLDKIGSIGTPLAGSDAAILDEETLEPVDTGEVGEIYMQVPCGMDRYYEMPESTDEITIQLDGSKWMTAGDMGRVDEDSYFYIEDRKDEMIITGGENVYPSHIEDVLHDHPAIKDVAVFGVPDNKWGERVVALATPAGAEEPSLEEIKEFCRGQLADYEIPRGIDYITDLPRNSTGKVVREEARGKFSGGRD